MTEPGCKYRFSFEKASFIDYPEVARTYPLSKLKTQPDLGLLDRNYDGKDGNETEPSWTRFSRYVTRLNDEADAGVTYKVLFVVRHGRGVHNVVMDEVGSDAWKNHWSHLTGDGKRVWFDAELVDVGRGEAKELGAFYEEGILTKGFPVPDAIYTSPLARCLETTQLVFETVMRGQGRPFHPKVKEFLRERLTNHTCDRRRSSSWIKGAYPEYEIEPSFAKEDVLWHADRFETPAEHTARTQQLFEDVFANEAGTFIAMFTHSYTFSAVMEVIASPAFRVDEGVMVAFLVKGQKLDAK